MKPGKLASLSIVLCFGTCLRIMHLLRVWFEEMGGILAESLRCQWQTLLSPARIMRISE